MTKVCVCVCAHDLHVYNMTVWVNTIDHEYFMLKYFILGKKINFLPDGPCHNIRLYNQILWLALTIKII